MIRRLRGALDRFVQGRRDARDDAVADLVLARVRASATGAAAASEDPEASIERLAASIRTLGIDLAVARSAIPAAHALIEGAAIVGEPIADEAWLLAIGALAPTRVVHVAGADRASAEASFERWSPRLLACGLRCARLAGMSSLDERGALHGAEVVFGAAAGLARERLLDRVVLRESRYVSARPARLLVPCFEGVLLNPLVRVTLTSRLSVPAGQRDAVAAFAERLAASGLVERDASNGRLDLTEEGYEAFDAFARQLLVNGEGQAPTYAWLVALLRDTLDAQNGANDRSGERTIQSISIAGWFASYERVSGRLASSDDSVLIRAAGLTRVVRGKRERAADARPDAAPPSSRGSTKTFASLEQLVADEMLERQLALLAHLRVRVLFAGSATPPGEREREPNAAIRALVASTFASAPSTTTTDERDLRRHLERQLRFDLGDVVLDVDEVAAALEQRIALAFPVLLDVLASAPGMGPGPETSSHIDALRARMARRPYLLVRALRSGMLDVIDAVAEDHPAAFEHLYRTSRHLGRSRLDPSARLQVRTHQALATALAHGFDGLLRRLVDDSEALSAVAESYERSARERVLGEAEADSTSQRG